MLYHIGGSIKIENKIIMKIVKLKVFEYKVFQKMLNICIVLILYIIYRFEFEKNHSVYNTYISSYTKYYSAYIPVYIVVHIYNQLYRVTRCTPRMSFFCGERRGARSQPCLRRHIIIL